MVGTGRNCVWVDFVLVGQQSRALVAFVPPVSIGDRPLLWIVVRSQTYYSKHICLWSGKTCYSLVMGSGSFWTDCYRWIIAWRSKQRTELGSQVLGAWSPSLDRDLDPLIGVEQVGLVCT
jgi:hypothetical protein